MFHIPRLFTRRPYERLQYRSSDNSLTFDFVFWHLSRDEGWRIYIINSVNYGSHDCSSHSAHWLHDYYCISEPDYFDILGTIKHTASTFERTPSSYKGMHEEDLRNTLLAALNGIYKGDATGEAFRKKGKTDICIERENRAAFVAECKMWTGKTEVAKAVSQLDSYLTWRDCRTALIYFVRRKNFLSILETARAALESIDGMKNVRLVDKNEFDCLFLSKENPGQQVKMRVMLFNLNYHDECL